MGWEQVTKAHSNLFLLYSTFLINRTLYLILKKPKKPRNVQSKNQALRVAHWVPHSFTTYRLSDSIYTPSFIPSNLSHTELPPDALHWLVSMSGTPFSQIYYWYIPRTQNWT